MHILLTQRKLATGSFEEWRKAWMSKDQEWMEQMATFVASTGADGLYEVEEVTPRQ